VLGQHVTQKGSLVDANRLRFDFSHHSPVTVDELQQIENLVNEQIRHNQIVETQLMKYDEAIKHGAMALFGEKYTEEVRVIGMGKFSVELCGGTHVTHCGDIGFFKIIFESGVAAGIRRIEAITGKAAVEYVQQRDAQLLNIASLLKASPHEVTQKITQIIDNVRHMEKELARLKSKLASSQSDELAEKIRVVKGIKLLSVCLEGANAKALRETMDKFKDKLKSCIVVLASTEAGKVTLIAGVTSDLTEKIKAGELVNFVAKQVGGKGGGRADMAQAGGTQPDNLSDALESVADWVEKKIAQQK
nr:alanine--tRNA ligase [Nitrosomonas sp.]